MYISSHSLCHEALVELRRNLFPLFVLETFFSLWWCLPVLNSVDWTWFGWLTPVYVRPHSWHCTSKHRPSLKLEDLSVDFWDRIVWRRKPEEGYKAISTAVKVPMSTEASLICKGKKFVTSRTLRRAAQPFKLGGRWPRTWRIERKTNAAMYRDIVDENLPMTQSTQLSKEGLQDHCECPWEACNWISNISERLWCTNTSNQPERKERRVCVEFKSLEVVVVSCKGFKYLISHFYVIEKSIFSLWILRGNMILIYFRIKLERNKMCGKKQSALNTLQMCSILDH